MVSADVVIVGAGLAGLCCALELVHAGRTPLILEASDDVGGRVRTDSVQGPGGAYLLDRGFQILLTAYPEASARLDLPSLDLCAFEPGAIVRLNGTFHTLMDPLRRPASILESALSSVGSLADKLRVGLMRAQLGTASDPRSLLSAAAPERTIAQSLQARCFSPEMIDRFFTPFFGGITFDPTLSSSSRMMDFVFRCFASGDATVPRRGMQEIPRQLASRLPAGLITLNTRVTSISPGRVSTASGEYRASAIVLACDGPESSRLRSVSPAPWRASRTCWYAFAGEPPMGRRTLILDGDPGHMAQNVAFMSTVSPLYAPPAHSLVCVTPPSTPELLALSDEDLDARVRARLTEWFGDRVATWTLLKAQRIALALPDQSPPWLTKPEWPTRVAPGLYVAGDHRDTASIDGAMYSGRRAAETILADTP